MPNIDIAVLQAALQGLEAKRAQIEEQIAQVRAALSQKGGRVPTVAAAPAGSILLPAKKRRRMSPEGRRRIAEATRRRWEEFRRAKAEAAAKEAMKGAKPARKAPKGAKASKAAAKTASTAAAAEV